MLIRWISWGCVPPSGGVTTVPSSSVMRVGWFTQRNCQFPHGTTRASPIVSWYTCTFQMKLLGTPRSNAS